ncbi:MAG TPA: DUF58 domain-containing protein [Planctomycetaceae bacterium]|nr:DUF58 domain-containing protein [Planctomycetaceae bacterium]
MKWLVLVLLVLGAALIFQMGLLAFGIYTLLSVALLSRFLVQASVRRVQVRRTCSHAVAEVGTTILVAIELVNDSPFPIPWLLLQDVLPFRAIAGPHPALAVRGSRIVMTLLWPRQRRRFHYQLHCRRRGYFQIGPLLLESGDLFGLFRKFRLADEPLFVMVYPEVVPLLSYDVASRRPIGEVVMTHRLYEDPTRIAGVRDYQAGDPLNRVHWKATARTGTLQSKVYEPSTVAGATLVIDFHAGSYRREDEPLRSERTITAAASIAHALNQMDQQVGLVSNGRDGADRIRVEGFRVPRITRHVARKLAEEDVREARLRPVVTTASRGPESFTRLWEQLARLELNQGLDFAQLLIEAGSRIPRDATALALLGDVTEMHVLALDEFQRRGYAVAAVVNEYDEERFQAAAGPLIAAGIPVYRVRDDASIADMCRQMVLA